MQIGVNLNEWGVLGMVLEFSPVVWLFNSVNKGKCWLWCCFLSLLTFLTISELLFCSELFVRRSWRVVTLKGSLVWYFEF